MLGKTWYIASVTDLCTADLSSYWSSLRLTSNVSWRLRIKPTTTTRNWSNNVLKINFIFNADQSLSPQCYGRLDERWPLIWQKSCLTTMAYYYNDISLSRNIREISIPKIYMMLPIFNCLWNSFGFYNSYTLLIKLDYDAAAYSWEDK